MICRWLIIQTFEVPIDDLTRLNAAYWVETKPLEQGKNLSLESKSCRG